MIMVRVKVMRSGWILKELDGECDSKRGIPDDPRAFGQSKWKRSWWIAEMVRTEGAAGAWAQLRTWEA